MHMDFLPELFHREEKDNPGRGFTQPPVNKSGLVFPYPPQSAPENWTVYYIITGHLVVLSSDRLSYGPAIMALY